MQKTETQGPQFEPVAGKINSQQAEGDLEATLASYKRVLGATTHYEAEWRAGTIPVVILQLGGGVLLPDDGFARIYDSNDIRYNVFTQIITTW